MGKYIPLRHHATVGDLLKFIEKNKIPMHAPVMMQRVTDNYFDGKSGWSEHSAYMKGEHYRNVEDFNRKVTDGTFKNKEDYPDLEPGHFKVCPQEDLDKMMEQYYQAWCPVFYKEEPEVLFLDAHY